MRENPKAHEIWRHFKNNDYEIITVAEHTETGEKFVIYKPVNNPERHYARPLRCLLYTSPSPRDLSTSRMPSSA